MIYRKPFGKPRLPRKEKKANKKATQKSLNESISCAIKHVLQAVELANLLKRMATKNPNK